MIKRFEFLFLLLLLSTGNLFANVDPGYRGDGYKWKLDAEFLYFLPTFDDTFFVIQNPSAAAGLAHGTRLNNDFNFRPGFRVGGSFSFCGICDGELQAFYTRLSDRHTRLVSGGFLWATVGDPEIGSVFESYVGTASSELDFLYQRVDGFYSRPVWCHNYFKINGLLGLEYVYLRFNEEYIFKSATNTGSVHKNTKISAIGPQFGFDLNYLIWQLTCWRPGNLSLAAKASGSILATRTDASHRNLRTGSSGLSFLNITDERDWRLIAAFHARLGLNYATCFSCWQASLEVGYEFTSYNRALARTTYVDDIALGLSYTEFNNFDVQGLYIALNAAF